MMYSEIGSLDATHSGTRHTSLSLRSVKVTDWTRSPGVRLGNFTATRGGHAYSHTGVEAGGALLQLGSHSADMTPRCDAAGESEM